MATAKVNGAAFSVQPNRPGSGVVNNRGVTVRAGSSTSLTNVNVSRYNTVVFASTVLDNSWADEALAAGTFAYNNTRPVAMRYSTTISGVTNTILRSAADDPTRMRSIHKLETLRTRRFTTAIRSNKYNRYTGAFDGGFPVVATDSLSTDTAATPTRSSPGQLTYKLGQPVPVTNNDYKAKTV